MTVKELIQQLEVLDKIGMGDQKIVYIDSNDITHDITEGVHDNTFGCIVLA